MPDGKGAVTVPRAAGLTDTFTLVVWVNPTATREAGQPPPLTGISGQRYAVFPTFGSVEAKEPPRKDFTFPFSGAHGLTRWLRMA